MEGLPVSTIYQEHLHLHSDLKSLISRLPRQLNDLNCLESPINSIVLIGTGDSFSACLAAQYRIINSHLACYCLLPSSVTPSLLRLFLHGSTLFVFISSSGNTPELCETAKLLISSGFLTLSFCCNDNSLIGKIIQDTIYFIPPMKIPSPSIRTWQASLVFLYLLASTLCSKRKLPCNKLDFSIFLNPKQNLFNKTREIVNLFLKENIALINFYDSIVFVGSRSYYGLSRYSASKVIECTGRYAFYNDLYEWRHTEHHLYPNSQIIILFTDSHSDISRIYESSLLPCRDKRMFIIVSPLYPNIPPSSNIINVITSSLIPSDLAPLELHLWSSLIAAKLAETYGTKLFPGR